MVRKNSWCFTRLNAPDGGDVQGRKRKTKKFLRVKDKVKAPAEQFDHNKIFEDIKDLIVEVHGIQPYAMFLLWPGSVSKTSSGKSNVQRAKRRMNPISLKAPLKRFTDGQPNANRVHDPSRRQSRKLSQKPMKGSSRLRNPLPPGKPTR